MPAVSLLLGLLLVTTSSALSGSSAAPEESLTPSPGGVNGTGQIVHLLEVSDTNIRSSATTSDSVTPSAAPGELLTPSGVPEEPVTSSAPPSDPVTPSSPPENSRVRQLFRLLETGESSIQFSTKSDVILLLGVSGSGKSTLMHHLAGDNSRLVARRKHSNMIITDNDAKISSANSESKTLFPEYMVHEETGHVFVDCPGFIDTRNETTDIAAGYFIKKALDKAKNVKLIFVAQASALSFGNDRHGFMNLLTPAADLITNVSKFRLGIGLVVTKVANRNDDGELLTDSEAVSYIRGFLGETISELRRKTDSDIDVKIEIVSAMLDLTHGNKIGLFRKPNKEGPLSENAQLQTQRGLLLDTIFTAVLFVSKSPQDVQYTLSDKSKIFIDKVLMREINKVAKTKVENLAQLLHLSLNKIGGENPDMVTLTEVYNLHASISKFHFKELNKSQFEQLIFVCITYLENIGSKNISRKEFADLLDQVTFFQQYSRSKEDPYSDWSKPVASFASVLANVYWSEKVKYLAQLMHVAFNEMNENTDMSTLSVAVNNLNIRVSKFQLEQLNKTEFMQLIFGCITYLEMNPESNYQILRGEFEQLVLYQQNWNKIYSDWRKPLSYLASLVSTVNDWYVILHEIHNNFQSEGYQKSKSVVSDKVLLDNGFDVNHGSLFDWLKLIEDSKLVSDYRLSSKLKNTLERTKLPEFLLRDIRFITKLLSRAISCSSKGNLKITGHYLSISSDVVWAMNNRRCSVPVSSFEIHAFERLYVDADFIYHMNDAVFLAPSWRVYGNRIISVKGVSGVPYTSLPGTEGASGYPGRPGGPGGSVLAVGHHFENSENLQVVTSGGDGGPGQNGRKGKNGAQGEIPPFNGWYTHFGDVRNFVEEVRSRGYTYEEQKWRFKTDHVVPVVFYTKTRHRHYYEVRGSWSQRGTEGSKGGDGGRSGLGGIGGRNLVISLRGDHKVSQVQGRGAAGRGGKGGQGGKGGTAQGSITLECVKTREFITVAPKKYDFLCSRESESEGHKLRDGPVGRDNYNSVKQMQPTRSLPRTAPEIDTVLTEYINTLQNTRTSNEIFKSTFIKELTLNKEVRAARGLH